MDNITASEIAGLGVGALLLCATIAAPKIDAFISSSQRSSLGMCKRCGNLRIIACSSCKGVGSVREGVLPGFDDLLSDLNDSKLKKSSVACMKCNARGHFSCPDCTKS